MKKGLSSYGKPRAKRADWSLGAARRAINWERGQHTPKLYSWHPGDDIPGIAGGIPHALLRNLGMVLKKSRDIWLKDQVR